MIKQIFAAVLLIGVVALLAFSVDTSEGKIVVRHGNVEKKPLEIELNKYLCFESKVWNSLFKPVGGRLRQIRVFLTPRSDDECLRIFSIV